MKKILDKNFESDYPEEGDQFIGNIYDVYKKAFEAGLRVGFNHGYTCACANLVELTGDYNGTMEAELYGANFKSKKQLKDLCVDKNDIKRLSKTIKYIEDKRDKNLNS